VITRTRAARLPITVSNRTPKEPISRRGNTHTCRATAG